MVSRTDSMMRVDSNLDMPRRFPMELMMWSLVRAMDALLREEGVVLNGVLFLWDNFNTVLLSNSVKLGYTTGSAYR
jgi:hypothetical protein